MKIILPVGLVVLLSISIVAQDVDISRLYVESEQDTAYILDYAVSLIPTYKKVSPGTINCAITEIKKSGMFKDIKTELVSVGKGEYYLFLKPVYKGNPSHFKITEISLEGFETIDKKAFREQLEKQNVKVGASFTPYRNIRHAIFEKLNDFDTGEEKTLTDNLWINAYLVSPSSIHLVLKQGRDIPTCSSSKTN